MAQTQQENDGWESISVRSVFIKRAEKLIKKDKSFGTVSGLLNHLIRVGLESMEASN